MKTIPKFLRGEFEKKLKELSEEEQKTLEEFSSYCSINANRDKVQDMIRNVLKFKLVIGIDFKDIEIKNLRDYLVILNKSNLSDYSKNDSKVCVKKFLRWKFEDWEKKFNKFEDIKLNKKPLRKKIIDEKTILTKAEIEKIMKTETKMYWKAFFITQYEGGLRTKEARTLKWSDLNEENDFYTIDLHSTKTQSNRPIILKESLFYLNKLKEEQTNTKDKGVYIFHSKRDKDKPITKHSVAVWLNKLSIKAIGRRIYPYILRHTRGSELRTLVKNGKMSKDNATEFLGHSEKMFDKVYSHLEKKDIKEMLKEQIYNFEDIPQEKKLELNEKIKELQENSEMQKGFNEILVNFIVEDMSKKKTQEDIKKLVKEHREKIISN